MIVLLLAWLWTSSGMKLEANLTDHGRLIGVLETQERARMACAACLMGWPGEDDAAWATKVAHEPYQPLQRFTFLALSVRPEEVMPNADDGFRSARLPSGTNAVAGDAHPPNTRPEAIVLRFERDSVVSLDTGWLRSRSPTPCEEIAAWFQAGVPDSGRTLYVYAFQRTFNLKDVVGVTVIQHGQRITLERGR